MIKFQIILLPIKIINFLLNLEWTVTISLIKYYLKNQMNRLSQFRKDFKIKWSLRKNIRGQV